MNTTMKLVLGILTALAMLLLTFAIPRGGGLRDAQLAAFPTTVGIWAIFVLLFVKLKKREFCRPLAECRLLSSCGV
jgi:hypothetical protein